MEAPRDGRRSVGKPVLEQAGTEGLRPGERTHAGAVHEELQPMGRTHAGESSWRTVSRGWDPTLEQGKSVMHPAPDGDEMAEITCDELSVNPIPHPPALLGGGGGGGVCVCR